MKAAVIGAGASGLSAIKACLEEGISPVCFETKSGLGGVWKYLETPVEGQPSVFFSTITNSDKETLCFSDFPCPEEFPNFIHQTKVLEYLTMYAKQFDLEKYIRYETEVIEVSQMDDFNVTGKWTVTVKNTISGARSKEVFDAVFVCNGHHAEPLMPQFEGTSTFKGKQIHSHMYRNPIEFQNKRVIVVGLANTAGDIAAELTHTCSQVFVSARRSQWIVPRFVDGAVTSDFVAYKRFLNSLPCFIQNLYLKRILNRQFNHSLHGIRPSHEPIAQQVFVNDSLPTLLSTGRVIMKPNIKRITESGVIFDDGTVEVDIDAIIYATGYLLDFSFVKHPSYAVEEGNVVNLYKFVFAPDVRPNTLAIIGCIQPYGSVFPILELQSRWAAAVFKNVKSLPTEEQMNCEITKRRQEIADRYVQCPRYTTNVEWINYMDEIAEEIGCKPSLSKLFLTDPRLALSVYFGECIPSHYRLTGRGNWPGARHAILTSYDRMIKPLNMIGLEKNQHHEERSWIPILSAITLIIISSCVAFYTIK